MLSVQYVKRFLNILDFKPLRRLGQSFMVDEQAINQMGDYANLNSNDVVLEIGAGLGLLTRILAERVREVLAVEIDPKLFAFLQRAFNLDKRVRLYHSNFLDLNLRGLYNKVVSNPPYSISSKILLKLMKEDFELGILTLQKEFANKLTAKVGMKDYCSLTILINTKAEVELLETLPCQAFYPKPKVSSTIVKIKPRRNLPFEVHNWVNFERMVRILFTQRKRKVKKALQTLFKIESSNRLVNSFLYIPFLERRIFSLKPNEFGELFNAIYQ